MRICQHMLRRSSSSYMRAMATPSEVSRRDLKCIFARLTCWCVCSAVVTKPPYEITETGWGEFEIIIKIFFIDPNERPVTLYHLLKLFQSDSSAMPKKTVVSEFYDEMIFQDPTAMMQQLLTTTRQLTLGAYKHETEFGELEQRTKEKMEGAKKRTSQEITELKDKLKASRENINHLKMEIRKLEEDGEHKEH
ncbi:YEATS domain-containing protein 4 isoform X2 [Dunckerocampus dactyliophorus]|uniref:YEATS domain-containing protein 4 isoform X2 n=1 Tax=Dunckerocampus dactyliophorus TaxID=161453 RepID=UPI002405B073|nr:YEATS domain-containing protein 4 isoform X2 [Dunckerocampus dactyliophorus]